MKNTLSPRGILEHLVAFPTVSSGPNAELIDWVASYLADHGVPSQTFEKPDEPGKKALFAHVGPEVEGGVVLSGHTDVVPVEGQAWDTDPWTLTEKDGRLYGRGSTDMKGFDALAIWAMVEAQDQGLRRPLQLALSYDEEIGCTGVVDLIDAMTSLPKASDVIVGEPTMMRAVLGHKGGLSYNIHVHGFEVHSSIMHTGVSAIMWGAKLITWANAENERRAAAPPSAVAAQFDPPYSTLHVGTIQGGTAHNITAKDCTFCLGVRVVPGETLDAWRRTLHAQCHEMTEIMRAIRPQAWVEMQEAYSLPPFVPSQDNTAESLVRQITGDNSENYVSYATEASHFQTAGYQVVVCGPGDIAVAHQPNESLALSQLEAGQVFMQGLVQKLA